MLSCMWLLKMLSQPMQDTSSNDGEKDRSIAHLNAFATLPWTIHVLFKYYHDLNIASVCKCCHTPSSMLCICPFIGSFPFQCISPSYISSKKCYPAINSYYHLSPTRCSLWPGQHRHRRVKAIRPLRARRPQGLLLISRTQTVPFHRNPCIRPGVLGWWWRSCHTVILCLCVACFLYFLLQCALSVWQYYVPHDVHLLPSSPNFNFLQRFSS